MKKKLLSLLFVILSSVSYAQQAKIDSLKNLLDDNRLQSNSKLEIFRELSELSIQYSNVDESIELFLRWKSFAKKLNNLKDITDANRYLSESFMRKQNFDKARYFVEESLRINDSLNNASSYLIDINQLGRVYHYFQKFTKAIEIYNKGLEKYGMNYKNKIVSTIFGNIGNAYGQLGNTKREIEYYIKQAQLAEDIGDANQRSKANYNIAWVYKDLVQYKKSEEYFFKALKDSNEVSLKNFTLSSVYHGLGGLYSRWGKYQKALIYDNYALNIYRETGNRLYEFDVLNNIAVLYQRMGKPNESLPFSDSAISIIKEINPKYLNSAVGTKANALLELKRYSAAEELLLFIAKDTISFDSTDRIAKADLYENLYFTSKGKGDMKRALRYHERFKEISDSILISQRDSNVTEIETKYQTEKKEKENLQLKAETAEQAVSLEKESKRKWFFAIGLLASLLSLGIFAFYYQRNKKQKLLIESLQRDLHHRVKNNLAIIDSLIEDIKDEFDEPRFAVKLTDLQNRIDSINEVHRQLYQGEHLTNLNMKRYVEKLANNIKQSFDKENVNIINEINDNFEIPVEKSFPLGLIINEFVTNSLKYAFKENEKGEVRIQLIEQAKTYILSLSDNGKGLPDDFDITKLNSFGMDVMQLLSRQINGTFLLKRNKGVQIDIEFPKL